jgi:hypothetical protein
VYRRDGSKRLAYEVYLMESGGRYIRMRLGRETGEKIFRELRDGVTHTLEKVLAKRYLYAS